MQVPPKLPLPVRMVAMRNGSHDGEAARRLRRLTLGVTLLRDAQGRCLSLGIVRFDEAGGGTFRPDEGLPAVVPAVDEAADGGDALEPAPGAVIGISTHRRRVAAVRPPSVPSASHTIMSPPSIASSTAGRIEALHLDQGPNRHRHRPETITPRLTTALLCDTKVSALTSSVVVGHRRWRALLGCEPCHRKKAGETSTGGLRDGGAAVGNNSTTGVTAAVSTGDGDGVTTITAAAAGPAGGAVTGEAEQGQDGTGGEQFHVLPVDFGKTQCIRHLVLLQCGA